MSWKIINMWPYNDWTVEFSTKSFASGKAWLVLIQLQLVTLLQDLMPDKKRCKYIGKLVVDLSVDTAHL